MMSKVEQAVKTVLSHVDAYYAFCLEGCFHCHVCAYNCPFFNTFHTWEYVPVMIGDEVRKIYRYVSTLSGRILRSLASASKPSERDFEKWAKMAYNCFMCGGCSVACASILEEPPFTHLLRSAVHTAGLTPKPLADYALNELETGHPLRLSKEEWLSFIESSKSELGFDIPIDLEGADYLLIPGWLEVKESPSTLKAAFKALNHLTSMLRIYYGVKATWTVSSEIYCLAFIPMMIGDFDGGEQLLKKVVEKIEKLKPKTVVVVGADYGFRVLKVMSRKLLKEPLPFQVKHILTVLDENLCALNLNKHANTDPVTYHDPCQIARWSGVYREARGVLKAAVENYREMYPSGLLNWCCMGGGGLYEIPEKRDTILKAFALKADQIYKTRAKIVATACTTCKLMLAEGCKHYGIPVEIVDAIELVAKAIK
ncbi:MAG: hypothetical protein DRJ33_06995 [Candidatus Methanomethylicota archaeon]|uniref:(Fe-S)-binding protein n=1 Tax=Thermoproteota archaeon TaxID=2056631 RepID=A0A497ETX5_9CREN|nr:MAG: hypothetical protein DRJ33_06995 [Candidatus Verstraetearchaeota archaeon]